MSTSDTSIRTTTAAELRRGFLAFFRDRDHVVVPSSPLAPNDPTLLFTTAGMVQFKPYYSATGEVPYTRAVSIQKCLRLTDLERVGMTPRHDTFFEMLGNFSFGSVEKGAYFKEEAIAWAWEFVTRVLGLPAKRLHVSVFGGEGDLPRDDESESIWKQMGVAADHIVALGREDNFWGPAGGQGACGPCNELYFDLGASPPPGFPAEAFWGERAGDAGERFMEFWNLVFPQFDARTDGSLTRLPRPGIDTGMGIERLALIVQGKRSIFETDLFAPIVEQVLAVSHARAGDAVAVRDARIIADHARALTFAIAEGVLPGNEGAGYVLRRLLRRAVTRGRSRSGLAIEEQPLLASSARIVCERFGNHYPELLARREAIARILEQEEAAFIQTYEAGLTRLEQFLASGSKAISGADAFTLHDTYGFPVELTEEIALERGVRVDREGFTKAMEEQRQRAREASKFRKGDDESKAAWVTVSPGLDSEFIGYDRLEARGLTLRRWRPHGDQELDLVFDRTPCYAESGGQVADHGWLIAGGATAELTHVIREGDAIVHRAAVWTGEREPFLADAGAGRVEARVDQALRRPTMRHHTATHLLHASLRHVLGTHVRQAGSLVAPDRLRFDYTHFEAPPPERLAEIERRVNDWVLANREVSWRIVSLNEARDAGAMMLFGEKYGERVRLVAVDGVPELGIAPSLELCGGTHVGHTGDIGAFVMVSDASIASGVRRIEALCGHEALGYLRAQSETLRRVAALLQTGVESVPQQLEKLKKEHERLAKDQAVSERGGLEAEMERLALGAHDAPQGRWLVAEIATEAGANAVRDAADRLRVALKRGAAVLAVRGGDKVTFLACATDDLVQEKRVSAADLVKRVAQVTGGSGGGKPHLALAGAKDASKAAEALAEARRLLEAALT